MTSLLEDHSYCILPRAVDICCCDMTRYYVTFVCTDLTQSVMPHSRLGMLQLDKQQLQQDLAQTHASKKEDDKVNITA